jgi:hypothetical protein
MDMDKKVELRNIVQGLVLGDEYYWDIFNKL